MPKLSIIVPIFNGEEYLQRCIDSILSQQYTDFELILIDDGSTDNSLSICNEYAEIDSRIVVYHKENAGLVAARKSGLSIAKGEYIGFVDCDDFIDENMYSDLMETAEKDDSDIVAGGIIFDYSNSSKSLLNMFSEGYYNKAQLEKLVVPQMLTYSGFVKYGIIPGVVVKVFRRSILNKALPNVPDTINIGEDVAITAYSVAAAESLSIIPSASYHYIQNEDSMIRSFDSKRFEKICALYYCLINVKNADYVKQLDLYMSFLIFNALAECVTKSGYEKKDMIQEIKKILNHDMSVKVLKNTDITGLNFKDKLKILLMRYSFIRTLIILI